MERGTILFKQTKKIGRDWRLQRNETGQDLGQIKLMLSQSYTNVPSIQNPYNQSYQIIHNLRG